MIRTGDLTRDFGTTRALDHVSMHVSSGSIYGLVGPNGAGKTTILNLLAGVDSPTSGTIQIDTDSVALLPDTPSFDAWLTGREVVELSLNLGQSVSSLDVDAMLEATGIERYYTWTIPPGMPTAQMNEYLELFATEVMPHFR